MNTINSFKILDFLCLNVTLQCNSPARGRSVECVLKRSSTQGLSHWAVQNTTTTEIASWDR